MIDKKTLSKLEFSAILQKVAVHCKSAIAQAQIEALTPALDFDDAVFRQEELTQAYNLYAYETSFDFSVDDITEIAHLARVSSTLSMGQLLIVMRLLKTSRNLRKKLCEQYDTDTSILQSYASMLFFDEQLENDIDFAIISDEEMNDKASSQLYAIRRKIKQINADIQNKLQGYTKHGDHSKYLQDAVVTIRNGRYVIPVKQEYRSNISGIVHDQSGSGSTLFVEPIAVVELNNQLKTSLLEEVEEIQRILQQFTQRISPYTERLLQTQDTIVHLDVVFCKVKYALDSKATKPQLNNNGFIKLTNARHPLIEKSKVVPISVELGKNFDIVVITGPNTGGKTVSLKTVGLVCIMAMAGLYIPASEGSVVSFFQKIFCDIGDEQSIEQSLSTFSSHITNLKSILSQCDKDTLVLVDEVGAGTEPNEGAALALAITDFLLKSKAKCIITTHYGQLKEFSLVTDGVENASMEFNPQNFEPTYRLIVGVPGSSNAIAIASKLGLQSSIIEFAQRSVSTQTSDFEEVLKNAEHLRRQYEQQQQQVEDLKVELQKELARSKQLNEGLAREREKLLSGAKIQAKRVVEEAETEAKELVDKIKHILNNAELEEKSLFEARSLAKQIKNAKYTQNNDDQPDEYVFTGDKVDFSTLKIGDTVFCQALGVQAKVTAINGKNKISIQAGAISSTVNVNDLYFCKTEANTKAKHKTNAQSKTQIDTRTFKNEINVLGQTVGEAIANVDAFIDNAVLMGINNVFVIHGMGTGRLRQGLHEHFRQHPNILQFRLGKFGEGESGVTVITLK